jgi:hypothetical protein
MLVGVDAELLAFSGTWLETDPRLLLACQFISAGERRGRFLAVTVLMRELAQAVTAVSDRRVAEVKLAWWADEAQRWTQAQPRHPLAHGLDPAPLGAALATLVAHSADWLSAPAAADTDAVWERMQQLALATADLLGDADAQAWAMLWLSLSMRLSIGAPAALACVLPMDLWARHGLKRSQWPQLDRTRQLALLADLAARTPQVPVRCLNPATAALLALERRWLQRLSAPRERIGILDTLAAWSAARTSLRS